MLGKFVVLHYVNSRGIVIFKDTSLFAKREYGSWLNL